MLNAKRLSPKQISDIKERMRTCLFELGLNQVETAQMVGIDKTTASKWIKDWGWREDVKNERVEAYNGNKTYSNSLNGFLMWLLKQDADLYNSLQPHYDRFIHS